jgi:sugar phosphate isomerase/epimerase
MKKRRIISIVLLLVVAGFVSTTFYSCKPSGKYIGLQLYSIRDSIMRDVPGAIAKVADMGYKFVEPAGYNNGKFYGMEPADFKALLDKNNLPMISSHTGQALPDSAHWDEVMAWWDACIDAHAQVGAKYIVQPFMGAEAYRSLDTLKLYCNYFNAIGEKCNAKGIRFGYHNHDREFSTQLDGQTIYDVMLENTDPSKVTFEMDLYWTVMGGANPIDYFNKYPGRFELWHIKDKYEVGGEGTMMDWKAIWAGAEKAGMKYGVVEVEEYTTDEFTSCQKSLEFLNNAPYVVMPKTE